ncbi:MAG: beta-ketoacyl-ACP synthase II [Bacteroidales bacterium]|nr:beta-ketoacyl-ACP synthase II [Bacteroidales bacterium]
MELKRVVVTGMGAISPVGLTSRETWKNVKDGVSGAALIDTYDTSTSKTKFACTVKNFKPELYFDRKELRKLDRFCQFALISSDEAIKDSNINFDSIDKTRAGVIWASGIGGSNTIFGEIFDYAGSAVSRFSPFFIPKMIADIAAGTISIRYGLMGPNYNTVSACASSANAIIDSVNLIRLGMADMIVTGGSEASVNEVGMEGFQSMQAISKNNDEYQSASRPFCATRDGFVMGEGGCALVLEEYEHALERGAKIYAEIVGVGLSADAYHITAPHPEGLGGVIAMTNALKNAGINPDKIDYINAHATSTPIGDLPEIIAIQKVFGEHAYKLNISSTKSEVGHLLGAAGAIESMFCIFSINENIVPPTINHKQFDEKIDRNLNLTLHKAQNRIVDYAMSNAFGFSGHNTSIIFKKMDK